MRRVKSNVKPLDTSGKQSGVVSVEAREGQLINMAMDVVEQRMRDNTASSQEVVHFLRLGSLRERYEREKLENENALLKAKVEALQSQSQMIELYSKAIEAMRRYNGVSDEEENNDEGEY